MSVAFVYLLPELPGVALMSVAVILSNCCVTVSGNLNCGSPIIQKRADKTSCASCSLGHFIKSNLNGSQIAGGFSAIQLARLNHAWKLSIASAIKLEEPERHALNRLVSNVWPSCVSEGRWPG